MEAPVATLKISSSKKDKAKKEHLDFLESLTFRDCAVFYTDGSQGIHKGQKTNYCAYCRVNILDNRPSEVKYWN